MRSQGGQKIHAEGSAQIHIIQWEALDIDMPEFDLDLDLDLDDGWPVSGILQIALPRQLGTDMDIEFLGMNRQGA